MKNLATGAAAGAAVIAGLGAAGPLQAQQGSTEPVALEEVVVTARKREENLQEVPLSITAFTRDALDRRSITELEDIALLTPGFTFEDYAGGGFGVPTIRGASQQNITILEQNVSVFLDGVYIPRAYAFDLGAVDMERIEIVKGPQSALYGQNAFMGAVNYVSVQPGDEFDADVRVNVGSDELAEVSGAVNLPLGEQLAVRLGGAYSEFDGTWRNNHPLAGESIANGTRDNVAGREKRIYGAQLRYRPAESLDLRASFRKFDIENEAYPINRINPAAGGAVPVTPNCGRLSSVPTQAALGRRSLWCGELPGITEGQLVVDPRTKGAHTDTEVLTFSGSWDASDAFRVAYTYGDIEATAEQISTNGENTLLIPRSQVSLQAIPAGGFDYRQHELRLEYDAEGRVRAAIGAFQSKLEDLDRFRAAVAFLPPPLGPGVPSLGITPVRISDLPFSVVDSTTTVESRSVFASLSVGFLDERLRLTAEGRYQQDDKAIRTNSTGLVERNEENFFTPRVSVDYRLADGHLLYALAAQGTKAGGINANPGLYGAIGLVPEEKTFDADENVTIELGTKNDFAGGRLRLNAAVFFTDWSDMQISAASTVPRGITLLPGQQAPVITLNLGDATIQGIELEGLWSPTDALTFNLGASYTDATFDDDVLAQRIAVRNVCDGIVCPVNAAIGGNELPRSSAYKANVGFNYGGDFALLSDTTYFLQADLVWQSKQYVDELNLAWVPERTLLNASFGIQGERYGARLWAKNLLDEEYVSNAFFITQGFEYVPNMGPRRQFGLTLTADF
jgi:iron complex outermembrane receptor protein